MICGFAPEEWPRCGIVVGDEGGDGQLQFLDAAMNAAADLALGQKREPALDLIEPGGVGGSEVEVIARPPGKPGFDGRRLVGGVIVQTRWISRLAGTTASMASRKRRNSVARWRL